MEAHETFQKQTYRNRCVILGANNLEKLIIPVVVPADRAIQKVEIDHSKKWISEHLNAFQSAYGKAPYFEHFYPYFEEVFQKKVRYLYEFNHSLLTLCLKLLGMTVKVSESQTFEKVVKNPVFDARSKISPKKQTLNSDFASYPQMFGNNFVQNLSVVDLLFCEGPQAQYLL